MIFSMINLTFIHNIALNFLLVERNDGPSSQSPVGFWSASRKKFQTPALGHFGGYNQNKIVLNVAPISIDPARKSSLPSIVEQMSATDMRLRAYLCKAECQIESNLNAEQCFSIITNSSLVSFE